eukprot:9083288-Ditylum_brightwellii.AAC.1
MVDPYRTCHQKETNMVIDTGSNDKDEVVSLQNVANSDGGSIDMIASKGGMKEDDAKVPVKDMEEITVGQKISKLFLTKSKQLF